MNHRLDPDRQLEIVRSSIAFYNARLIEGTPEPTLRTYMERINALRAHQSALVGQVMMSGVNQVVFEEPTAKDLRRVDTTMVWVMQPPTGVGYTEKDAVAVNIITDIP